MDHENIQNQDLNLVLSSDAKPILKWTPELHRRFIDAVTQLGGPEKASPKSLMRVIGIHGLTLSHLKTHLQKYRLGNIQQEPACSGIMQEEFVDNHRSDITTIDHNNENANQINNCCRTRSMMIAAQALQMQMEVQRKLHEQIEVQRHLQLRIEAQGKYLQYVLRKAQDTLAGYNSSSIEADVAKTELSHLLSMVDNGCPSSLSVLTEREDSTLKKDFEENRKTKSSLESSLISFDSSGRNKNDHRVLSLMEKSNIGSGRKRSGSTISDRNRQGKRLHKGSKKFDLNSQYVNDFDFESKSNTLDFNSK